jgi:hypothetical protein
VLYRIALIRAAVTCSATARPIKSH